MAGVALDKQDELVERINAMGRGLSEHDELDIFAWNRLLKDIQKAGNNPALAQISLLHQVVMWGMRPDRERMRLLLNEFAAKFGKTQDWYLIRSNYATLFGDVSMVLDLLTSGAARGGVTHMSKVVDVFVSSGLFVSAWNFLLDISEENHIVASELVARYPFLEFVSGYVRQHQVDERDVAKSVVLSTKVVVDFGFRLRKFTVSGDEGGISIELNVDADIDRLVDMNFAISDSIAVSFDELISNHVSTGVVPWRAGV